MCLIIGCMYNYLPTNHDIDQQLFTCGVYSQQYTEYRNGYSKDHPVIVNFWEVFEEFTEEHNKKFLSEFMEGSD